MQNSHILCITHLVQCTFVISYIHTKILAIIYIYIMERRRKWEGVEGWQTHTLSLSVHTHMNTANQSWTPKLGGTKNTFQMITEGHQHIAIILMQVHMYCPVFEYSQK